MKMKMKRIRLAVEENIFAAIASKEIAMVLFFSVWSPRGNRFDKCLTINLTNCKKPDGNLYAAS